MRRAKTFGTNSAAHQTHSGTSVSLNPKNENLRFVLRWVGSLSQAPVLASSLRTMRHTTQKKSSKTKTSKHQQKMNLRKREKKKQRAMISIISYDISKSSPRGLSMCSSCQSQACCFHKHSSLPVNQSELPNCSVIARSCPRRGTNTL